MSDNVINVAQISGTQNSAGMSGELGAGALIVNDYRITTEPIDGGHRLTITRGSEVQTMDLMDGAPGVPGEPGPAGPQGEQGPAGADGYTPKRGVDYWTAADQQAIVDDVLAALPDGTEVSY